ncbi:uncharacterized protein LOC135841850 [Planococcus citri]|uniref:uncharacterized protein LOC135841850 n=1 Tax=Planococcus citri TaxID=170843 RepID=UPI0031F8E820
MDNAQSPLSVSSMSADEEGSQSPMSLLSFEDQFPPTPPGSPSASIVCQPSTSREMADQSTLYRQLDDSILLCDEKQRAVAGSSSMDPSAAPPVLRELAFLTLDDDKRMQLIMKDIDSICQGVKYLPFLSLTRLPENVLFTVSDVTKRYKGKDNAPFTGIHISLDNQIRTSLPKRIEEQLLNNLEYFNIFSRTAKIFEYKGIRELSNKKSMALIKFRSIHLNGCLCDDCTSCNCLSRNYVESVMCECFKTLKVNDGEKMKNVITAVLPNISKNYISTLINNL